jgi:CRISPR/Cas system-associated protein Csm6
MRLSLAPAHVVSSGYKPEPPRNTALTVAGAIAGLAIVYYAMTIYCGPWVALIQEIAK